MLMWQEFNFGVEFILLIAFKESSLDEMADDALTSFAKLLMEFPSLIVQATKGIVNECLLYYTKGQRYFFYNSNSI